MNKLNVSEKNFSSAANINQFKLLIYYAIDDTAAQAELYPHLKSLSYSEVYDHLEGGFFTQQCLNNEPFNHSKSLSNNADLIDIFSASSGLYFDPIFSVPAINSLQWLLDNFQSPDGFFFLKNENEETLSNYHLLTHQQIQQQLDNDAYIIFMSAYNLTSSDFNIAQPLKLHRNIQQISTTTGFHIKHIPLVLESAHQQLISLRKQQPSPSIDPTFNLIANTKIVSSLYVAATLFNRDDFALAADKTLANIHLRFNASKDAFSDLNGNQWLIQALLKRLSYQWSDDLYQWLLCLAMKVVQEQNFKHSLLSGKHCESIINDFNILYILSSEKVFFDTANLLYEYLIVRINKSKMSETDLLLTLATTILQPRVIIIRGQNFQVTSWQQQISSGFKPQQFIFSIGNKFIGPDPDKFPITPTVNAYSSSINSSIAQIETVSELLNCCP